MRPYKASACRHISTVKQAQRHGQCACLAGEKFAQGGDKEMSVNKFQAPAAVHS